MDEKRDWVYIRQPTDFGIDNCECGTEPEWSEYKKKLWCANCKVDYTPLHWGVFDGPIPIGAAHLLGMSFDYFDLKTNQVKNHFVYQEGTGWISAEEKI